MIILKGVVVSLKTMLPSDVTEEYLSWLSDPKVNKHLEVRFKIPSKAEAISFVKGFDHKSSYMFLIYDTIKDTSIGTATLRVDTNNQTAVWGYLIGNLAYWGSKAGVESIQLLLNFAFDELCVRKVSGAAHVSNIGSAFNFKKMGFVQEGRLRAGGLVDGKETDLLQFGILKAEWLERRKRLGASA